MFSLLKQFSSQRFGWVLLTLSALTLEGIALYFQHGMGLQPCVMCIYERIALLGIAICGLVGMLYPQSLLCRLCALLLGLLSAYKGLSLAIQHVDYQLNPAPWNQCLALVDFPAFLPLDTWLPNIFKATGFCSDRNWIFLDLSMPQWLIGIFAFYLVLLAVILISQISITKQP